MSTRQRVSTDSDENQDRGPGNEPGPEERRAGRPRLRLVVSRPDGADQPDDAGTTTAEYTVVTGAAVAFGALLFKLLTSSWGNRILGTAFQHVIALLGF